jgi:putative flippase GtrA
MGAELFRQVVDRPLAVRLRRFVVVGTVAAAVQMVLLWLLVELGGLYYLVGATVAIEVTIVLTYVLNNAWTFDERSNDGRRAFLRGLAVTNVVRGSAIPLQLGVLFALTEWAGVAYLLSNAVAILVSGLYRYVLDARFTWGA